MTAVTGFVLQDALSRLSPLTQEPLFQELEPPVDLTEYNHPVWASHFDPLLELELSLSVLSFDDHQREHLQDAFDRVFESMVKCGFRVNKKILWQDFPPLHRAAEAGCERVLNSLIREGADVNSYAEGDSGSTPLYLAARHNRVEVAKVLINRGANVNRRSGLSGFDELPLHVATSPEMCKLLVKSGCPVNAKSSAVFHETALHWAAHCARPDMVLALLKLGALDVHFPGRGSALDVARKVHFQTCGVMGGREWDLKITRLVVTLLENPDLGELLYQTELNPKEI